jgi:hypothetical protein
MSRNAGIYICLILLMLASVASAAYIDSVTTDPTSIDPQGDFTVTVTLGGTTCGTQIRFLMDGKEFDSKNVGCNNDDVESDEWDLNEDPVECGVHELSVELMDSGEVIQTETKTLTIGNVPTITMNPEKPNPDREVVITFKNKETGKVIGDLEVFIHNAKEGPSSVDDYTTDSKGEIKFVSSVTGEFVLRTNDPSYCGTVDFWVKKNMPFAGPSPEDPVVGERIGVAVPGGVGVKYIDSKGEVYPLRNLGGGVNFTIDKADNYTLIAGDLSTIYWSVTKEFTVSEKSKINVAVTPEKAVVDKVVLLTITSRGAPLENAKVKITKPIGGSETIETNPQGEVRFTSECSGSYHYKIEKERYSTVEGDFEAYNSLEIDIIPDEPIANQDVAFNVTNQVGDRVDGAVVTIEDESGILVTGNTGIDGSFKFRLQEPREYTLTIQKIGYWDLNEKLRIYGVMSLGLNPQEIEIGDLTSISVRDKEDKDISADITVTKPDGGTETIDGKTYTPNAPGDYEIKATKGGYRSVTQQLRVNPHPLELVESVEGNMVIIRALSHREPVPGITFVIKTPTEEKRVVTDGNGTVTATIEREGDIEISANTIDMNRNYENIEMTRGIIKQYNYLLLIVPVFFIIIVALITVLFIDHLHKKKKKKGVIKSGALFDKGKKKGSFEGSTKSSLSKL